MTTISGRCELVVRGREITQEMGTYLAVENVFVALAFHLHLNSNRCALAFMLVVFAKAVPFVLFLCCGAGVASLDLAQD